MIELQVPHRYTYMTPRDDGFGAAAYLHKDIVQWLVKNAPRYDIVLRDNRKLTKVVGWNMFGKPQYGLVSAEPEKVAVYVYDENIAIMFKLMFSEE